MLAKSLSFSTCAFLFLSAISLSAADTPVATTQADSGEVLDQRRIHTDYNEGNFERVITALETFMGRNKAISLEDSVFIAKHLAVVYTANPQTREKGKYFMYRLLALLPTAKLLDMYVSDEIDRIFEKVREEYMTRQKAFQADSTRMSQPRKSPSNRQKDSVGLAGNGAPKDTRPAEPENAQAKGGKSGIKPVYIIAGGSALVAAVAVSYFMFSDSPQTSEKIYDVR